MTNAPVVKARLKVFLPDAQLCPCLMGVSPSVRELLSTPNSGGSPFIFLVVLSGCPGDVRLEENGRVDWSRNGGCFLATLFVVHYRAENLRGIRRYVSSNRLPGWGLGLRVTQASLTECLAFRPGMSYRSWVADRIRCNSRWR